MKEIKMKKLIIITSLALASMSVVAKEDPCVGIYDLSKKVMEFRQAELPLNKLLEVIDLPIAKKMALDAYGKHVSYGKDGKASAAKEFGNTWYMACLKSDMAKGE